MTGKTGDRIIVESERPGYAPRGGEILAVDPGSYVPHYRVLWTDGHRSVFTPAAGAARIIHRAGRRPA
jgi:Domain of unknown function (DUF1918)